MEFEWNPKKAAENLRKHKVSFQEAASVFGDFLGATVPGPERSVEKKLYITIGLSNRSRWLMVAHMEFRERIRIISARTLTPSERKAYEETQK